MEQKMAVKEDGSEEELVETEPQIAAIPK